MGRYKAKSKPAPMVAKYPTKYLVLVTSWGWSLLDSKANKTEDSVNKITQFKFMKVIFCFTMITDKMRLNTNCDDKRRDDVDTGRYELPHENKRLFTPNMKPMKIDKAKILGVKPVKGFL